MNFKFDLETIINIKTQWLSRFNIDNMLTYKMSSGNWRMLCMVVPVLVIFLSTQARANEVFRLAFPGHVEGMWGSLAVDLSETAAKHDIVIDHYKLADLGGHSLAVEMVRNGMVDIAAINSVVLAKEIELFEILNLPFLAANITEARSIVDAIGPSLENQARSKELRVLGYTWEVGTFVSDSGCVLKPEDLNGARILYGPPLYQELFRLAGASPVAVNASEIFAAMTMGLARTGVFTVEEVLRTNLPEATGCLTDPEEIAVFVLPIVIVANQESLESLSDEKVSVLFSLIDRTENNADSATMKIISEAVNSYMIAGRYSEAMNTEILAGWRDAALPLYDDFRGNIEGGDELLEAALRAR